MNKLELKNSFYYFFANTFVAALPFMLLPLLTREFTVAEYGIIGMFNTSLTFLYAVVGLKSETILNVKFFTSSRDHLSKYVFQCLILLIFSLLLYFLVLFFFNFYLISVTGLDIDTLLLAGIVAAFNFILMVRLNLWMVEKKALNYASLQSFIAILNLLFTLMLIFLIGLGFNGRIYAIAISIILCGSIALISLIRNNLIFCSLDNSLFKEVLYFSIPVIIHTLSYTILTIVDRFLVRGFLGEEDFGIYILAVQLGLIMVIMVDSIKKIFLPIVYEALSSSSEEKKKKVVIQTYIFFIFYMLFGSFLIYFAEDLISIIATDKFIDAVVPFQLLVLCHIFYGMYDSVSHYLFFKKETTKIAIITFISATLTVVLLIFLIPIYKLSGAPLAILVGAISRFIMTWFISAQTVKMPWFSFSKNRALNL